MKIWSNGEWMDVEIGQRVFIGTCGTYAPFGELGTLARVTARHCIFRSDSGSEIKTRRDNIMIPSQKWRDAGWWVSLKTDREYIQCRPGYWDAKKCDLCYK